MSSECVVFTEPGLNPRGGKVMAAMSHGLRRLGYQQFTGELEGAEVPVADVGVIWGITSNVHAKTKHRNVVIEAYKKAGRPIIVCERGWIRRDDYHGVGLGWIGGRADFRNADSPSDRWEALGVGMLPALGDGDYDLVIGQLTHDTSCQHADFPTWMVKKMASLRGAVFRPHPLTQAGRERGVSLEADLAGAKAVHTFNSTVGVDALIAGKPVFADDEGSMVWGYMDRVQRLYDIAYADDEGSMVWGYMDRVQRLYDIAYAQWTLEEMAEGAPIRHLLR